MPDIRVDVESSKEIFAGIGAALTGLLAVFAKIYSRKLDKEEKQLALAVEERIKEAEREDRQEEREISSQIEYIKGLQLHISQLQQFLEDAFKKQKQAEKRWEAKLEEQQTITNNLKFGYVEMEIKNRQLEHKVASLEIDNCQLKKEIEVLRGKLNEKSDT